MHKISEKVEYTKAKIRIVFEDETFLVLYKGMYKQEGNEMTDEDYDALVSEMTSYGKKRAMNLLLKKDYSRRALCKKLEDDGYNPEIIDRVFVFLDSYHYLDDMRIAENVIKNYKGSKSRAEIRFLLKKREIPDDVADAAMESAYTEDDESGDIDTEMTAVINNLKKLGMTPEKIAALEYKDRQKLAAKLFRKGFKAENITKALRLESFE